MSEIGNILDAASIDPNNSGTNVINKLKAIHQKAESESSNSPVVPSGPSTPIIAPPSSGPLRENPTQIGYQPPPPVRTDVAQQLINNSNQMPNRADYQPSRTRRILADIGGIASGILSKSPEKGIQTAENIKDQGYNKALMDYIQKQKNLEDPLKAEQDINKNSMEGYKAGGNLAVQNAKLGQGEEKINQGQQKINLEEFKANANDDYRTKALKQKASELAQRINHETNEEVATGLKTQLTNTQAELNRASREKIAAERNKTSTINARIMASGRNEPSSEDQAAAEVAKTELEKTNDPSTRERIISGLKPNAKEHLMNISPQSLTYKKLAPNEQPKFDATLNTLNLIPEIQDIIKKRPDIIGPALGRAAGLQGVVGVQDEDTSYLQGLLTNYLLNEASMYGSGRVTKSLLDEIKQGGVAKLSQQASQFEGKLNATKKFAEINHKNLAGYDYKPKSKYKVEVVGDAPDK